MRSRIAVPIVALAAVALLGGCGEDGDSGGSGNMEDPPDTSAVVPGPVDVVDLELVSGPDRGSHPPEAVATPLPDRAALQGYAASYSTLRPELERTAESMQAGEGETLYAQHVASGCQAPPVDSLTVTRDASGEIVIATGFKPDPTLECFVAHESVALAVVTDEPVESG